MSVSIEGVDNLITFSNPKEVKVVGKRGRKKNDHNPEKPYEEWNLDELKKLCKQKNLPTYGGKAIVISRLRGEVETPKVVEPDANLKTLADMLDVGLVDLESTLNSLNMKVVQKS